MSDMAANATGHKKTDHLRIVGLAELAIDFAREVLAPGGAFVAKVLQGGTEGTLLADLKRDFAMVRHVKPAASRAGLGGAVCAGDRVRGRGMRAGLRPAVRGFDEQRPSRGGARHRAARCEGRAVRGDAFQASQHPPETSCTAKARFRSAPVVLIARANSLIQFVAPPLSGAALFFISARAVRELAA